ncbi:MAG TPA: hypothetical protein VG407_14520 [Caulobacteraceae bacterium]|jgi:hypothetical protein|nr:hypothetical protein [Caulobacteraceae bacterium]
MSAAATVIAAAAARARREIVQALRDGGALSEASATSYRPPSHLCARVLARMIRQGVVHETASGDVWLDEPVYAARAAAGVRTIFFIMLLVVAAAVIGTLIRLGMHS